MSNILEALGISEADMIHRVIGNTFIVEMGIVKDIPADGIVTVEMSVASRADRIIITDCVLANTASSAISVNIKPEVDDKVLVLFPRKFAGSMFDPDKNEPIISEAVSGYSVCGGIAILMNQFKPNKHKNYINFEDGNIELQTDNIKAKFTSEGFNIEDKNGCKIVSSSTSIKINNHLEIRK